MHARILTLVAVSTIILSIAVDQIAAAAAWQQFTFSKFNFSIKAPAELSETQNGRVEIFETAAENCGYYINVADVQSQDRTKDYNTLISEALQRYSQAGFRFDKSNVADKEGQGWKGKLISNSVYADGRNSTCLISLDNDKRRFYQLDLVGPASSDDANTFFNSFAVLSTSNNDILLVVMLVAAAIVVAAGLVALLVIRGNKKSG